MRHEIAVQGTGFFTKDSQQNGTLQHSTNTGGFLVNYRFHINGWLAAEASYGYDRNTQQNFTPSGNFGVQTNVHQATGALVANLPVSVARMRPYVLAGAGALVFDPTGNNTGIRFRGAERRRARHLFTAEAWITDSCGTSRFAWSTADMSTTARTSGSPL